MKLALILNTRAGTLRGLDPQVTAEGLAQIFRDSGHTVTVAAHSGKAAVEAVAHACRDATCDAVIVGGGDGTISTAAAAAAGSGMGLGIIPLGTMNLFARSLRIPLEMKAAAEALAKGNLVHVDIGEVNGRFFVHHVTLGLHARMIRIREGLTYKSRWGKILAAVRAWWMVIRRPPRMEIRVDADGEILDRKTPALLVTNNPLGEGHLPYADDLRQGVLGMYIASSRRWRDLLELSARLTLGEVRDNPLLETRQVQRIAIRLNRSSSLNVSVDGELITIESPLTLTVRKGGLSVLMPALAASSPSK